MAAPSRDPQGGAGSRLAIGLVRGLHGLRGAVRVEILTDNPARFEPGSVLHVEGRDEPLTVVWAQEDGPGILLRFAEASTRTNVEPLRGKYLEAFVGADDLGEHAAYWHELIGVPVATGDGEQLGTVHDVFRAGEADVLVVRGGARGEVLVPAVRSAVTDFAPREGRIVVDRDALALDEAPAAPRARGRRTTRALKRQKQAQADRSDGPDTGSA